MSNTTLGVVIVHHNRPQLAVRACKSVLHSNEVREVVLVDDASTVDIGILIEFCMQSGVKFIQNSSNEYLSSSRRTGLGALCTTHVLFLDDDDMLYPNKLDDAFSEVKKAPHIPHTFQTTDSFDGIAQRLEFTYKTRVVRNAT